MWMPLSCSSFDQVRRLAAPQPQPSSATLPASIDLLRDDVRVIGHEAHQVELTEHAENGAAVTHHQSGARGGAPSTTSASKSSASAFKLTKRSKRATSRTEQQGLKRGTGTQQGVAQVGGGEDAQAGHRREPGPSVRPARDQLRGTELTRSVTAVHVERLAQVGIADARCHQRQHLALRFRSRAEDPVPRKVKTGLQKHQ